MSQVRFRRCPRVLWRSVGGEVFLTAPDRTDFDRLSETGGVLWSLLDVPRTLPDLAGIVASTYEIPMETIGPDVETFLEDLLARGWVEQVEECDG